MKLLLLSVFGFLAGMSALAVWMLPREPDDGRIPLVWTSDPAPMRMDQVRVFEELYPRYRLTLDYSNASLQALLVQSSSGVGPDLFDVHVADVNLQTLVEAGIAWDITEFAAEGGFGVADTWPAMAGAVTYQGRQYGYPANVNVDILIYNKNVFDDLGVPYPVDGMTWEEFFDLALQATRRTRRLGTNIFGAGSVEWRHFFYSLGGEYFSEDGTELLIDDEKLRKAFQMHRDAIFEHGIKPSTFELQAMAGQGGWGAGAINQFAAGRYATISIGKWSLMGFHRAYRDQQRELERWEARSGALEELRPRLLRLGAVRLPHFEGRPPAYRVSGKVTAVNALSSNREAALDFLRYQASEPHARLVNESNDALPPNPEFKSVGVSERAPGLAEEEIHETTIESMRYGYQLRNSPFLLTNDVDRVLNSQMERIEANPELEVERVLAGAQRDLEQLMERNLARDPRLREEFERRRAQEIRADDVRKDPRTKRATQNARSEANEE